MPITKKPNLNSDEILIVNTIKQLRKYHGLSQDELADKTSLSRALISQLEAGWKHPRENLIKRLADAIDKEFFTSYLKPYFQDPTKRLKESIKIFTIPVLSFVAVNPKDIDKKGYSRIPISEDIAKELKNIPGLYALVMPDNSLADYALIRKRDFLIIKYVKIANQDDINNLPNHIVGAFINREMGFIRKLRLMAENNKKLFMFDMKLYDEIQVLTLEKMKDMRGIVVATIRYSMLDDITPALFENPKLFLTEYK